MLYLIAHKVRGEPAFDIAERIEIAGEEAWIIPTSGHRAYPYYWLTLSELLADCRGVSNEVLSAMCGSMPEGLRDHYEVTRESPQPGSSSTRPKKKVVDIDLSDLGL